MAFVVAELLPIFFCLSFNFPRLELAAELSGVASSLLLSKDVLYSGEVASSISELSSDRVFALSAIIEVL